MPAYGSMTTTLSGAAYLVEGVIRSPFFPPLRQVFWVKTLTFWSGNGGASGVTSSLEALLSVLCRLWGHGLLTLPTLFRYHDGCHRHLTLRSCLHFIFLAITFGCSGRFSLADALPPCWLKFI